MVAEILSPNSIDWGMEKILKSELLIALKAAKAITLKKNLVKYACKAIFANTNYEQKIRALLHV